MWTERQLFVAGVIIAHNCCWEGGKEDGREKGRREEGSLDGWVVDGWVRAREEG